MTNHELINELEGQKELVDKLNAFDVDLGLDISEIMDKAKDPVFVGVLIYRLISERQKTNKILGQINEKYDKIMFELKTGGEKEEEEEPVLAEQNTFHILPEQDQMILRFVEEKGSVGAQEVQTIMNYRGLNAASQRLNKLFKEGYLKKIHAGKRVLYLAKT